MNGVLLQMQDNSIVKLLYIFVLRHNRNFLVSVNFCEKLSESPTYTLNTDETIYNTLAVATCEDGLMFPDGILSKVLMCGLGAQWNDTTTDPCQRMLHNYVQCYAFIHSFKSLYSSPSRYLLRSAPNSSADKKLHF